MIPLMKNTFIDEFETKKLLADFIIRSERLSMGEECLKFEEAFAKYQGSKYCRLFNSGGSANLALLQALKNLGRISNGDKIGFSALTWSTNVMPILQLGFEAVPVDVEPSTLNVMSKTLEETIVKEKLKAFFITNALGFAGDLDKIRDVCKKHNVVFIEDNCESLATELPAGKTGNFGVGSTFSFFVAHHMSTVEGGCICTSDEELAEMLCIVRANGWDRNLHIDGQRKWRKKFDIRSEFEAKYTFYDLGYNLRPTEITGFLGQIQLKHIQKACETREANYLRFEKEMRENSDFIKMNHDHIKFLSNFSVPVICKDKETKSKYIEQFSGNGVEIRPMIAGNLMRQPFAKKYIKGEYSLPGCDKIHDCGFYFGNYPELTNTEIEMLCSALRSYK